MLQTPNHPCNSALTSTTGLEDRAALTVYAFVACDPETSKRTRHNMICAHPLRLREDNDFYNDFRLMAGKLVSKGIDLATGVVTDTDEQALDFLNKSVPLWPVLDL